MWLSRMWVPTRGRGKRSVVSVDIGLRNSFAVRSVCLCRRKWTREATVMYLPRVPRSLSFVKVCARSLALRHQSLTFCARLFATPCEKRSAWGGDCWLMYYLAGRHPSMLNFAASIIFFCSPQLMSTALMDLFRVNWLRLNNKNQKLRRGWRTFYEFLQKHKQNFKTSRKSGLGFSPRFRPFEEG